MRADPGQARFWYNLRHNRRGASAFEFALVLPIFVTMMCGTLQYGVLFYTWNVALSGARNAARAVAVGRADVAAGEAMMVAALPPWVGAGDDGDGDCGGGNGDPNDGGGYGQGGCGAGNGNGGGSGIDADVTDAAVGGEVVARMSFPANSATFLPLAPMPENVSVTVRMVKEA